MLDTQDVNDQIDSAALQQVFVLNMATQSLRPRLDAEGATLEESVVLGQMLAALSNLMLEWVKVLVGNDDTCCGEPCEMPQPDEERGPA